VFSIYPHTPPALLFKGLAELEGCGAKASYQRMNYMSLLILYSVSRQSHSIVCGVIGGTTSFLVGARKAI